MGTLEIRRIVRVAVGVAAVVAQVALAFFYVGVAILVVPAPANLVLALIWIAGVIAAVWLAYRDAWLAPLIPVAWLIVVLLMLEYGRSNLGWGA